MLNSLKIKFLPLVVIIQSCNNDDASSIISEPVFQFKWANLLSGPTNEDEIDAVASDSEGNVYVSGKFEQNLTIEGQPTNITSNGMADIMVVKYDKNGT